MSARPESRGASGTCDDHTVWSGYIRGYAGVGRRLNAVEMAREGVPLNVIQRQLGHVNLGVTSIYLQGIDHAEIIDAVHARRAPMIPASAGLRTLL